MNKFILFILTIVSICTVSCTSPSGQQPTAAGEAVDTAGAIPVDAALSLLGTGSAVECKVTGKVTEVCQGEGCWLTLERAEGNALMVRTKDQTFHFPKELGNREVVVKGSLTWDTTDVATLQQNARENGQQDSLIALISSPEIKPVLNASGFSVR